MALDRQRIERKDFPIGRRGYDPDAVDAHLAALADEVDELKRSSRRRTETLAAAASEQVRAIVEAAETSAADIQRQAEDEAQEIRTEASSEARATREQATSQARDYVGAVSESTSTMMQRLEAMESELGALIEALKTGGNRLNADLQLLENNLEEVRDAVNPRPRFQPEASSRDVAPVRRPAPLDAPVLVPEYESEKRHGDALEQAQEKRPGDPLEQAPDQHPRDALEHESAKRHGDALEQAPARRPADPLEQAPGAVTAKRQPEPLEQAPEPLERAVNGADDENARLIALNMALNGSSRAETERYLAENFRLHDQRGLLDDVYASIGP